MDTNDDNDLKELFIKEVLNQIGYVSWLYPDFNCSFDINTLFHQKTDVIEKINDMIVKLEATYNSFFSIYDFCDDEEFDNCFDYCKENNSAIANEIFYERASIIESFSDDYNNEFDLLLDKYIDKVNSIVNTTETLSKGQKRSIVEKLKSIKDFIEKRDTETKNIIIPNELDVNGNERDIESELVKEDEKDEYENEKCYVPIPIISENKDWFYVIIYFIDRTCKKHGGECQIKNRTLSKWIGYKVGTNTIDDYIEKADKQGLIGRRWEYIHSKEGIKKIRWFKSLFKSYRKLFKNETINIPIKVYMHPDLTITACRVYGLILKHANKNKDGECDKSCREIAEELGLKIDKNGRNQSVERISNKLEEIGFIIYKDKKNGVVNKVIPTENIVTKEVKDDCRDKFNYLIIKYPKIQNAGIDFFKKLSNAKDDTERYEIIKASGFL